MKKLGSIYQLKITLKDITPPIWRRVQVASNTPLGKLHEIVQQAMGWTNSHLHAFLIAGDRYGPPDSDGESKDIDYRKIKLEDIAAEGSRFSYEYDFGDDWGHELVVEKVLAPEPGVKYPICLAGKRACPPEDCGGPWGYAQLLEILADPKHEEHEERKEWLGDDFMPERFDLSLVDKQVRKKLERWD
jgi:hypothetical protein